MGKLKNKANDLLIKARTKSQGFLDELSQDYAENRTIPRHYLPPKKKSGVIRSVIENLYYGPLAQRDQTFIDYSDVLPFVYTDFFQGALLGSVQIMTRTVPPGQAWYIDDLYFWATALGGITNNVMLGPTALIPYFIFTVDFSGNGQVKYDELGNLLGPYPTEPRGIFPFLNDRVGSRQAKFGITLFETETITANVRLRPGAGPPPPPPPAAISYLGFRFMGIETPKAYVEEMLRRRRWDI